MRFGSDLDLVFVYREQGTTAKGRSHYEFYTKLAQRIGTLLTAPTQFGKLYDLDHRLRPFGSKGVLVPSLSAYRSFLLPGEASGADVWNFQAFTRIRTVCGDAALGDALIAAIAEAWEQRRLSPSAVGCAVWEMLNLLVEQNARGRRGDGPVVPLKFAVGGMIGYEFLQQAYFLCDRRPGCGWTAPTPREIMERLEPGVVEIGALDERLSFYERDGRHELRPEHCQNLAALGARWRFEEIEALCSRMEGEIAAAFRALSA
jgi:glutamine synthetase adenylyltransferase